MQWELENEDFVQGFKHVWEDVLHCRNVWKPNYFSFTDMR